MAGFGHNIYWLFPLFSGLVWLGTLSGLLANWVYDTNRFVYPSEDEGQTIPYISDTGAFRLKALFIAGSAVTVVTLDIGMIAERWLRHTGRLSRNTSWFQKLLSSISIFAAIVGAAGLILLSIFDTYRHPHVHDAMLAVFIVGYVVSAIAICWEFQRLGIKYRQHRVLRMSFWVKLLFILIEIGLAIAFGVLNRKRRWNGAAVVEWVVAYIFGLYVFSFVLDLLPAVRKDKHHFDDELAGPHHLNGHTNGAATDGYVTNGSYNNPTYNAQSGSQMGMRNF